jgi:hypothetical protein
VVNTLDEVFVHMIEDLIDFAFTEIQYPLDMIPETSADDISEPDDFSEEEEFNSESEDMEANNDHNEERVNPPMKNQPWLARDTLELLGPVHNLPRHLEKLLPKFDPETSGLLEDHIKKFILAIMLMNVQHEISSLQAVPLHF